MQEGWTALMAAANNGRYDAVHLLLENGANLDMQDNVSLKCNVMRTTNILSLTVCGLCADMQRNCSR